MTSPKRLLLFIVIGVIAFCLGAFALDDTRVLFWFTDIGYWFLALTFFCFLYLLYRAFQGKFPCVRSYLCSRVGRIGLIAVVLGTVFMFRAEPPGFRTIMDEHLIAATSKVMHRDRTVSFPVREMKLGGELAILKGGIDKRPAFFPFLSSLAHDLTDYRPYNGIYLNMLLSPFMLLLLYVYTERLGGPWAGVGAVALFCSTPLLGYICSGGGLQPLNLFFILLTLLLSVHYLSEPNKWRLGALVFSALLLAQCRYESVLFILPVGLVIVWSWVRERRLLVPWSLVLCPLLLVPMLWQNRIFRVAEDNWQMDTVGQGLQPFGLQYIYDNIGRAVRFYSDTGLNTPNSWLLAGVGLIALLLLVVKGLRLVREFPKSRPVIQAGALFLPSFFLLFLLLLSYGWKFDSGVIIRLGLPLNIPLAIAAGYVIWGLTQNRTFHRVAWMALAVYFIAYAFPVSSNRTYAQTYIAAHEFDLAKEFLDEHAYEPMIVVTANSAFFSLYDVENISLRQVKDRKDQVKFYLEQPGAKPIYYFTQLVYNPVDRTYESSLKRELDDDFVTELVWEKSSSDIRKVQFRRIVDVKNANEIDPGSFKTTKEYLRFRAKNLP